MTSHLSIRIWCAAAVAGFMLVGSVGSPPSLSAAEPMRDPVATALHGAIAKNIDHAREWLEQKDYKSLAQGAGGLQLLAELVRARGDNAAWEAATQRLVSAARAVQEAARTEDAARCQATLAALTDASAAIAGLVPAGQPRTIEKPPALRPLMLVMDATAADAKIALLTGNAVAAKNQAYVLSELGKLVSNSRSGEPWSTLASDFLKATQAAATTADEDPKSVRRLFRGISERCEACHETRGR